MSLPISPQLLTSIDPSSTSSTARTGEGSFKNILESAIDHVENSQAAAGKAVDQFLSGQGEELHSVALAIQRAELEFNLVLQIRNKVVGAYQEVMKMQV